MNCFIRIVLTFRVAGISIEDFVLGFKGLWVLGFGLWVLTFVFRTSSSGFLVTFARFRVSGFE